MGQTKEMTRGLTIRAMAYPSFIFGELVDHRRSHVTFYPEHQTVVGDVDLGVGNLLLFADGNSGQIVGLDFPYSRESYQRGNYTLEPGKSIQTGLSVCGFPEDEDERHDKRFALGPQDFAPVRGPDKKSMLFGKQDGLCVEFLSHCYAYIAEARLMGILLHDWKRTWRNSRSV